MNTHTLLGVVLHCITLSFNSTTSDAVINFQEKINSIFRKYNRPTQSTKSLILLQYYVQFHYEAQ